MEAIRGIIGDYVDLDNIQLSKATIAATVGVLVLSRLVWDEIKVRPIGTFQQYKGLICLLYSSDVYLARQTTVLR
jgi:hypothetical protein